MAMNLMADWRESWRNTEVDYKMLFIRIPW